MSLRLILATGLLALAACTSGPIWRVGPVATFATVSFWLGNGSATSGGASFWLFMLASSKDPPANMPARPEAKSCWEEA